MKGFDKMNCKERLKDYLDGYSSQYNFKDENNIEHNLDDDINEILKQNQRLEQVLDEIEKYITNFDVFKVFSFPLMKRWEEEQVKSSIDYEFNQSIKRNVLKIIQKAKGDVKNEN